MGGRDLFAPTQGETQAEGGRDLFQPEGFATTGMDLSSKPSEQSFAGGAAQQFLQGATLGFSDEIQATIAALVSAPFISDKTFGQIMADARQSFREENQQFQEKNPLLSTGLQVAGGLTTGGLAGGSKVAAAKIKTLGN